MRTTILSLLLVGMGAGAELSAQAAESWTPTRVNKMVELWEADQPVYYTQIEEYGFEECQALSGTNADYISINMEHSFVDIARLRACMQGLVEAGPVRSGHRTPAVIAVLPAIGWTEEAMRGNTWMVQQVHGSGVHGILLTHAADPAAVRLMIEAIRYPFAPIVPGLGQGMQGNGSQNFPARIWGVNGNEYMRRADVYPLSPEAEFIVGLKIENTHSQENVDFLVSIPGVSFVEHGPGDTGFWYGGPGVSNSRQEELNAVEERVFEAAERAGIGFLISCNTEWLERGAKVCNNPNAAENQRVQMGRQMPW